MKRIKEYKKLFTVEGPIDLKELKTTYRGLVKKWHPDKFLEEDLKAVAEVESTKIIDGYHFLVSISPETKSAYLDDYIETTTKSGIADFNWKKRVLEMTFLVQNAFYDII